MAPFKSNELKSDWRSDFLTEETDCDCEGCGQDPCIKCGKSHHSINEEVQGGVSVETYTKDTKFTEIETVNIIEPEPLKSTVNERFKFLGPGKNPDPKDMTKRKGEAVVDYTKLLVNKGKETVNPKKNEVIAASNELEGEQSLVEEVLVEDFMTDLYNEGYSVDEINEYLLEEYEIEEEYLEEVWGILAKGALKGAKLLTKGAGYAATRAVKDSGKVAKFAKNSKNWARANKDTQKVIDTVAKGAKDTKELAARTYAAGQKTRQIVDAGSKNLLGPAKSFKKLTSDFKKSQQAATRAINIEKIRATKDVTPVISKVKAPTNIGKVELPKINWKSTTPKGGTATQKATTSVKQITSSQPNKGLNAKFSKAKIRHRGTQELAKMQGKTPKQVKAKEVSARIEKGYNRNLEKTGDKIIKDIKATPIPKNKAIVKSPSGSLAKSTDKGSALTKVTNKGSSLTKTAPDKGSTLTKVSDKGSTLTKTQSTALSKTDNKGSALAKRKDNVKRAVAATSFATGSLGGVEVSKKLGLINKKEKNESFSDWRSEINL